MATCSSSKIGARDAAQPDGVELVVEGADAPAGDDPPGTGDRLQRTEEQRGVDRVPVRDERAGAQDEVVGDAGDEGEGDHRVDVGAVLPLHAVGVEDDVVAHPDGIEAVPLGRLREVDQVFTGGVLAEVGQQQPVAALFAWHCFRLLLPRVG